MAVVAGACTDATIALDGGPSRIGDASVPKDAGFEADARIDADAGFEEDAGVEEDAGACPPGFSTVRGSVIRTFFSHLGTASEPVDVEEESFAAVIPEEDGSFLRFEGTTGPAGTFTIPCVPDGLYYLEESIGDGFILNYRVTSSRVIQITDSFWRGSLDPPRPSGPNTRLAFDVTGLEPWEPEDRLELWTTHQIMPLPGLGLDATRFQRAVPLLADDALIDAARGERAALVQWSDRVSASGHPVRTITRIFEPPLFSTPDEETTRLSGTLRTVDTRTITVDWRLAELAAVSSAPSSPVVGHLLFVSSLPASATARPGFWQTSTPVLVTGTGTISSSVLTDLEVPVIFPDNQLVLTVETQIEALGGLMATQTLLRVPLSASDPGPVLLAPRIGPPRNLRVDGRDASGPLSDVGLTPTLTWDPPAVGQAAVYECAIFILPTFAVTTFRTSGRSLVLPPGALVPGAAHLVELSAHTTSEPRAISSASSLTSVGPITP